MPGIEEQLEKIRILVVVVRDVRLVCRKNLSQLPSKKNSIEPSTTQDFDYIELTVDSYGYLLNDRRHSLKPLAQFALQPHRLVMPAPESV